MINELNIFALIILFYRPGSKIHTAVSSWMLGLRSRSDIAGTTPLANLVFQLPPSRIRRETITTFF